MQARNSALVLNVWRNEPELVRPARPTPNEIKPLSDVDDLDYLRFQVPTILAYPATKDGPMDGKDPTKVIKAALAEALVYYYPWAGRLREGPGGRLLVDCTAEGVVFVEANADVRFDHFGEESQVVTPFPYAEKLFYKKASNTFATVGSPMLTIQVTRLLCGGFIAAFNFIHVMSDANGIVKFLNTVGELARGATSPSIPPVWQRELFNARDPPHVTCTLPTGVKDQDQQKPDISTIGKLVCRTFIFKDSELAALHARVAQHIHPCTAFELISACIWRCRTIALQYPPKEEVQMEFALNIRRKFDPPLPLGYYGNAFSNGVCVSQAGEICNRSLGYAVELVKKAKGVVTEEYFKSWVDQMALTGRNNPFNPKSYVMSDVSSRIDGFSIVDFGWGKPVYAGPPDNGLVPHRFSFIMANGIADGEMVSVSLPVDAMDRFVNALGNLLKMVGDSSSNPPSCMYGKI